MRIPRDCYNRTPRSVLGQKECGLSCRAETDDGSRVMDERGVNSRDSNNSNSVCWCNRRVSIDVIKVLIKH